MKALAARLVRESDKQPMSGRLTFDDIRREQETFMALLSPKGSKDAAEADRGSRSLCSYLGYVVGNPLRG